MWTSIPRTGAAHPTRSRRVGVAVAVLACVGLTACTAAEAPSPASTAEADTIAPFPTGGVLDAGTYLVTLYPVPFEVTVPDGWATGGGGLVKDDLDHPTEYSNVLLSFWPAYYVPTDACAWKGALVEIGPAAEAFVDAMTAQASTVSTPPVEVMVGDYSGFEFDHAGDSDVDFTACDGGGLCIRSNSAQDCTERAYTIRGERSTYLVVDLNGECAVIELGQADPSIDPALIAEGRATFDSIEFVRPDE
jgi:hypothetical protein